MRISAGRPTHPKKFDDARMERMMGRLLQAGVMLASLVVLAGGVLYLRAHPHAIADYRAFASEPAHLRSVRGVLSGFFSGEPGAIIELGILLLIATPVARVALAVVAFTLEGDRLYVLVSVAVLAVLLGSFIFSR